MENQAINISDENWLPVDGAYLNVLRIGYSISHIAGLVTAALFIALLPQTMRILPIIIAALLLCSFTWLLFVWAPRVSKRTLYMLREQDINLQKGFMFWKMISVSGNRIQHLEVRQGPIERRYGLATLVIYTAGTLGSDLKIPGLVLAKAQQLKSKLLNNINAEDVDVSESV